MKRIIYSTVLFLSTFLFHACEKDGDYVQHRLKGEWEILTYKRSEIYADGTEKVIKEEKNIGYWNFYESEREVERAKHILQYDFEYNGTPASKITGGYAFMSEEGKRIIIPQANCEGIGCDVAYTIKSIHHKKAVLEMFSPGDPNEQIVYKLYIELLNKKN
jgi:hypothetical protein